MTSLCCLTIKFLDLEKWMILSQDRCAAREQLPIIRIINSINWSCDRDSRDTTSKNLFPIVLVRLFTVKIFKWRAKHKKCNWRELWLLLLFNIYTCTYLCTKTITCEIMHLHVVLFENSESFAMDISKWWQLMPHRIPRNLVNHYLQVLSIFFNVAHYSAERVYFWKQ